MKSRPQREIESDLESIMLHIKEGAAKLYQHLEDKAGRKLSTKEVLDSVTLKLDDARKEVYNALTPSERKEAEQAVEETRHITLGRTGSSSGV